MQPKSNLTRRRFLAQTAAVSTLFAAPAILKSAAPNSNLQVASIGVGGMVLLLLAVGSASRFKRKPLTTPASPAAKK